MLNSTLETALGNKRIYCVINNNFNETHHKRECYKKFARELFDTREYTIFYLILTR